MKKCFIEALSFYEELYELARHECDLVISTRFKPTRCRIGDIIFDVLQHSSQTDQAVILCDGLPGSIDQEELMMRFSGLGYHVIFPRYQGTWESGGNFLAQSPAEDIRKVCDALIEGVKVNQGILRVSKVLLFGTSFGGSVALDTSSHPSVVQTIALSPVWKISAFTSIFDSLKIFLVHSLPGAYRFTNKDWQLFMDEKVIHPDRISEDVAKKVTIVAGDNDPEIPIAQLREFCTNKNICIKVLPGQKHLSFSKVRGLVWQEISRIIQQ